jgi:HEPN domain-containing protein
MNSRPQAWLKQAKDDLGVAELTRDNGYNCQACYFASQAAEKALKGLILELGAEPAYTHVLGELIKQLKQLGCNVEVFDSLPLSKDNSHCAHFLKPHKHRAKPQVHLNF